MTKIIDLTGTVFGRLKVICEAGRTENRKVKWMCYCSCGNKTEVIGSNLKNGRTKSCGCIQKEKVALLNLSHGLNNHPLYHIWESLKGRCFNKKYKYYPSYGGRGITVCDRWKDSFENFYNDVVEGYQKGLQIDRIDNNGNYEPDNVRWVTPQQNSMNTRSHRDSTSKYKGVSWDKKKNKWRAQISKGGLYLFLGYFTDEIEAARVYNERAEILFGEYANLNKV